VPGGCLPQRLAYRLRGCTDERTTVRPAATHAAGHGGGPFATARTRQQAEVIPVSLNAGEQRTLSCIADELAGSAPKLTSMLTVFNRLTSGEEMPDHRQPGETGKDQRHRSHAPRRRSSARRPRSHIRKRVWPITALALTVITAIVVTVLLILTSHGSGTNTGCVQSLATVCPGH
jgi:hypothetical protein